MAQFPNVPLEPLERGQLHVMRVRSLVSALFLLTAAFAGGVFLEVRTGVSAAAVIGPVVLWSIWTVGFAPARRWRRWGYAFTGGELHVAHGWLFRVHTVVPVTRVQHIDVTQGPVERTFSVGTLILHTAGTDDSVVMLPGITKERAEEIRDVIRGRIGDTPW